MQCKSKSKLKNSCSRKLKPIYWLSIVYHECHWKFINESRITRIIKITKKKERKTQISDSVQFSFIILSPCHILHVSYLLLSLFCVPHYDTNNDSPPTYKPITKPPFPPMLLVGRPYSLSLSLSLAFSLMI